MFYVKLMLYSFILACGVHRDNVLCPFMNNGNKNCIMIKSKGGRGWALVQNTYLSQASSG